MAAKTTPKSPKGRAKTVVKNTKKRTVRKNNLLKLCTIMNKIAEDAVDKEIIKRFKILIDTCDEDIAKTKLDIIVKKPETVDLDIFHESLQPYIKHYLFMIKRNGS
jgi:hypothetical protein